MVRPDCRVYSWDGAVGPVSTSSATLLSAILRLCVRGRDLSDESRVYLPAAQLAAVVDGVRARGLIDESGWLSEAGRETKERIESLTAELAAPAYDRSGKATPVGPPVVAW